MMNLICSALIANAIVKWFFMKIAIIKLSSLGDIIHTMVALQFIKNRYPESVIDWVVEERFKGILEHNPHINKIHSLNFYKAKKKKSLFLLFREFGKIRKFGQYDLIIDAQGLIKSAIVSKLIHGTRISGFDKHSIRESLASKFYNYKVSISYDKNTIDRNVAVICEPLDIKVLKNEIINKSLFLFSISEFVIPQKPYIVFVIGSTWESRNYPKEKFLELAETLKKSCVVVWGNEQEKEKADWMVNKSNYIKVMPFLSLDDLKFVILNSSLVIGNDTGPTHIAWGINIPSITIFGPTPTDRVYQTKINKVIKSSSKVDHFNLDKNDYSISDIEVEDIVKISQELLQINL